MRVRRVHVVPLAADADEPDRRAASARRGSSFSLRGDLGDRRVPVDALEAAVGAAAQRMLRRARRARRSAPMLKALLQM